MTVTLKTVSNYLCWKGYHLPVGNPRDEEPEVLSCDALAPRTILDGGEDAGFGSCEQVVRLDMELWERGRDILELLFEEGDFVCKLGPLGLLAVARRSNDVLRNVL